MYFYFIPKTDISLSYMFRDTRYLKKVVIFSSINENNTVTDIRGIFLGCEFLTSVNL